MGKKIAVFPEPGAIGPVMNLVGICQGLRQLGHEPIFVLEPGLKGTVENYGFEERHVSCMEPMSAQAQATYWDDFMIKFMKHGDCLANYLAQVRRHATVE